MSYGTKLNDPHDPYSLRGFLLILNFMGND
jgi:hypothetical protein